MQNLTMREKVSSPFPQMSHAVTQQLQIWKPFRTRMFNTPGFSTENQFLSRKPSPGSPGCLIGVTGPIPLDAFYLILKTNQQLKTKQELSNKVTRGDPRKQAPNAGHSHEGDAVSEGRGVRAADGWEHPQGAPVLNILCQPQEGKASLAELHKPNESRQTQAG